MPCSNVSDDGVAAATETVDSVGAGLTRTGAWRATAGVTETGADACICIPEEQLSDAATDKEGDLDGEAAFGTAAGAAAIRAGVEIARATSGDTRNNAFV